MNNHKIRYKILFLYLRLIKYKLDFNLNLINFIFHYFNIFYYQIKLNFIITINYFYLTINNFNQEPIVNNLSFSLFF